MPVKNTYSSDLLSRLRKHHKPVDVPDEPAVADLAADEIEAIGFVHASRYPKHPDPRKGQIYGGTCNTTRCDSGHAVFFNRGTYGLYCIRCARGQNANDPVPISIHVDQKPDAEAMDHMRQEMSLALRKLRSA